MYFMAEHLLTAQEQAEINSKPMVQDLMGWAGEYAYASNGRLVLLAHNPDEYPGQNDISVPGNPQAPFNTNNTAETAQEAYPALLEMLERQAGEPKNPVDTVGRILEGGGNVILMSNHGDLIDIALAQAAVYSTLHQLGYEKFRTGIVISKMIAFLAYDFDGYPVPCVSALTGLETEIFLSYPRTRSARAHLIHEDNIRGKMAIALHNRLMKGRVEKLLGEGGVLLAMTAGSTDKPAESDPTTILMEEVGEGTLKLMRQPDTFIAPTAIYYRDSHRVLKVTDKPRIMKSHALGHQAMQTIAEELTAQVSGKTFIYTASA